MEEVEITTKQENYFRVVILYDRVVIPMLRKYFREKWDENFPENRWNDSEEKGQELLKKIKGGRKDALLKERISKGQPEDWDETCIFRALSVCDLGCDEDNITKLKNIRNYYSHPAARSLDNDFH